MTRSRLGLLRARIGRRGAVLLLFSGAFFFVGMKALLDPVQGTGRFVFYEYLPPYVRLVLWCLPAAFGLVAAMTRRHGDAVGFAALCIPGLFVTAAYLWSFVGYLAGATEYAYGWLQAVQWGLIVGVLLIAAGWPEPAGRTTSRVETVLIEEPDDSDEAAQ